jgi:hypothetical protein
MTGPEIVSLRITNALYPVPFLEDINERRK